MRDVSENAEKTNGVNTANVEDVSNEDVKLPGL